MWPTLKRTWHDARLALHIAILLSPFALAAWVFHAAVSNKLGVALGVFGAAAVLLVFRRWWRQWAVLIAALWRLGGRLAPDLVAFASIKLQRAQRQVQGDWRDLRRWRRVR
ncbi:hypothetical protein THIX_100006 [Thiomonas sp. X19]|uniref:hypothetical protein n=1 Tax=Thiomonas sp. X19 TaxID=1050370 RepID=UPI000B6C19F6|nr:hypothetical protein [Thiomonas sp. X19]SCC91702.1 hypothetical protein THIX_100006 [Thiomonas sp. X19]